MKTLAPADDSEPSDNGATEQSDPLSEATEPNKDVTDSSISSQYPKTSWTDVISVQRRNPGWEQSAALLQQRYWQVVLGVTTKWGVRDPDNCCAVFFKEVFFKKLLPKADKDLGRFRGLLGRKLRWFIIDALRRQEKDPLTLSAPLDPERHATAIDTDFDRAFAREVVGRALAALQAAYGDRAWHLDYLVGRLSGDPLEATAKKIGMTPASLRVARYRARQMLRRRLLAETAKIARKEDVEEEARYLYGLFVSDGIGIHFDADPDEQSNQGCAEDDIEGE